MVMMALLPPGGLLGGYGADPDGVNGSWEEACTCVSTSIRVRVAVAGEYPRHLPQRLSLGRSKSQMGVGECKRACCIHGTYYSFGAFDRFYPSQFERHWTFFAYRGEGCAGMRAFATRLRVPRVRKWAIEWHIHGGWTKNAGGNSGKLDPN